ncbi:hypothetical protein [Streptomyces chryseus]
MDLRHRFAPVPGIRTVWGLMVRLRLWLSARLWALRAAPARPRLRAAVPRLHRIAAGPLRLYGRTVAGYTAADLELMRTLLQTAGVPYFPATTTALNTAADGPWQQA